MSENKEELISFLTDVVIKAAPAANELYVINGQNMLCSVEADLDFLTPCTHNETDTRMILHVFDAASKQCNKIMIYTVDTDVVVLV